VNVYIASKIQILSKYFNKYLIPMRKMLSCEVFVPVGENIIRTPSIKDSGLFSRIALSLNKILKIPRIKLQGCARCFGSHFKKVYLHG